MAYRLDEEQVHIGRRLSLSGIALGAISWGALALIGGALALSPTFNDHGLDNRLAIVGGCLFWGGPVVALVGLGLGIAGVVKRNPNKLSTIAGIAVPGLALIAEALVFIVAAYAILTVLSNQP